MPPALEAHARFVSRHDQLSHPPLPGWPAARGAITTSTRGLDLPPDRQQTEHDRNDESDHAVVRETGCSVHHFVESGVRATLPGSGRPARRESTPVAPVAPRGQVQRGRSDLAAIAQVAREYLFRQDRRRADLDPAQLPQPLRGRCRAGHRRARVRRLRPPQRPPLLLLRLSPYCCRVGVADERAVSTSDMPRPSQALRRRADRECDKLTDITACPRSVVASATGSCR